MIEGFRVEVTAEELVRHLDERIRHHHERAAEYESKRKRLETLRAFADGEDDAMALCGPSYRHSLEQKAAHRRNRAVLLMFLRDHVVVNEIYRLTEEDLRSLEWLPTEDGAAAY